MSRELLKRPLSNQHDQPEFIEKQIILNELKHKAKE